MADIFRPELSETERFAGDFMRTFARLLDPNLPPTTLFSNEVDARWPAGQTVAFALIGLCGVTALLTALFQYLA